MKRLAIFAAALALLSLWAPAAKAEPYDALNVIAEDTAVYARPGAHHPVVMWLEQNSTLTEHRRFGPGTHTVLGPDSRKETITIAAGDGEWLSVGMEGSDSEIGWVRAADVALDYGFEIAQHVVDPCWSAAEGEHGLSFETVDEALQPKVLELMLLLLTDTLREVRPLVVGRARTTRLAVYDERRKACIAKVIKWG